MHPQFVVGANLVFALQERQSQGLPLQENQGHNYSGRYAEESLTQEFMTEGLLMVALSVTR
jgi:hypothetical protein